MRTTIILLAILAQVLGSARTASAHADSVTICYQPKGTTDTAVLISKVTTADSVSQIIDMCTVHNFIGGSSYTTLLAYRGDTMRTYTDTLTGSFFTNPTIYVRVITYDNHTHVWDTSAVDTMYRYVDLSLVTLTPTDSGYRQSVTFKIGGDMRTKFAQRFLYDTVTGSGFNVDSMTSGFIYGGSTVHNDTVNTLLYPAYGWIRTIVTNRLGSDTLMRRVDVLPPPLAPAISWHTAAAHTAHTLTPNPQTNNYGYTATVTTYIMATYSGPAFDSVVTPVSGYFGLQDVYPSWSGLPADSTFYFKSKVVDVNGPAFTGVDSAHTDPVFTADMYGTIVQGSDTLTGNLHYSNVLGASCNITVNLAYGTPTSFVDTYPYPYETGSGNLHPWFVPTHGPGTYYMSLTAFDSWYTLITTSTVIAITVLPTSIDTAYAIADTITVGHHGSIVTATTGATRVTVSTLGSATPSADTLATPTYTVPGVYTYTVTAYGITTVTSVVTIVVVPMPPAIVSPLHAVPSHIANNRSTYIRGHISHYAYATVTGNGTTYAITTDSINIHTDSLFANTWYILSVTGNDSTLLMDSVMVTVDSAIDTTVTTTFVVPQSAPLSSTVNVYPNPTTDFLMIEASVNGSYNCILSDINGRQVDTFIFTDKTKYTVNVPNGLYFLTILNEHFKETRKIIVAKK